MEIKKETPKIYTAIWKNDIEQVKVLLKNSTQSEKNYALYHASKNSFNHIIKLLLDNGAKIDLEKTYNPLVEASRKNNLEGVKILIHSGAEVNACESNSLIESAKNGNLEIVKLLIKHGANVNSKNNRALTNASENNHVEVMDVLIKNGANIDANKCSPLKIACMKGNYEAVSLLLKNGATAKGYENNNTPIDLANFNNHKSIVSLLEEYDANLKEIKNKNLDKGEMKEYIEVLKSVKKILPKIEMQCKITEIIMKNELILPLLSDTKRKVDVKFEKFLKVLTKNNNNRKNKP